MSNQQDTPEVPEGQNANSAPSPAEGTGSRLDEATLKGFSDLLDERLSALERKMQSGKDRGVAEANKNAKAALNEAQKIREYLERHNALTPNAEAALTQFGRDQEIEDLRSQLAGLTAGAGQGSPQQPSQVNFVDAFAKAGYNTGALSAEDYQFAQSKQWANQTELENALFSRKMSAPQAPVSPAAVTSPTGTPIPAPNPAALEAQYLQELRSVQGQGYMAGDAVREKYRSMGLDVDNVLVPV